MRLDELQERCRRRFRDLDQTLVNNDDWTGYLNAAYMTMVSEASTLAFREGVKELSAGTGDESIDLAERLPGTFTVRTVYSKTDKWALDPMDSYELMVQRWPTAPTGRPSQFLVVGTRLYLRPVPDRQTLLEVLYVSEPAPLERDFDVPVIPVRFHRVLVEGALAQAYRDDDDERADAHDAIFGSGLEKMRRELSASTSGTYPRIRDTFAARAVR